MYIPTQFLRLDYVLQTVLIAINTFFILAIPFNFSFIFLLLYFQLFLGVYQFFTAVVHYFRPTPSPLMKSWRGLHLGVSIVLVTILIVWTVFDLVPNDVFGNHVSSAIFWVLLLGIPQILAYAYYFLTRLDYNARMNYLKNRATFSY